MPKPFLHHEPRCTECGEATASFDLPLPLDVATLDEILHSKGWKILCIGRSGSIWEVCPDCQGKEARFEA